MNNNRRSISDAALTLLLLAITHLVCATTLPDPLTLKHALELTSETHPALAGSLAEVALAQADAMAAYADDDVDIGIKLVGRYIEPNRLARDQSNNDSQASLFARKRLYDFGHTRNRENAATAAVQGSKNRYTFDLYRHRLEIMRLFFDVILADLEYTRDNEAMAIAFVEADRARDQNELGQVSDVDLLAKEDAYQARRIKRLAAEGHLRTSRARLALALNQPKTLPVNLVTPSLKENDQTLPEYEELLAQALEHNSMRQALAEQLRAAQLRVEAERAAYKPILSGSVQTLASQRDVGSRNPFQADITLEVPIYQGERIQAKLSRARAAVQLIQAEFMQNEYELRQEILEIWQGIQTLRKQREQVSVFTDFQALEFDRAQARYELELATDFGDALVGQSESQLLKAQTEFELALKWANLAILTAQPYSPISRDYNHANTPIKLRD